MILFLLKFSGGGEIQIMYWFFVESIVIITTNGTFVWISETSAYSVFTFHDPKPFKVQQRWLGTNTVLLFC